jgi:hypothetical protein
MKRYGIIVFGLGMLLAQPMAAQQTSPSYAPDVPNKSMWEFKFSYGSGVVGDWAGAPQVGPYLGNVGWGFRPAGAAFTLYCVDYANTIYSGYRATALVSNIGAGDFAGSRLGGAADALVRYQKSAYLASLFFANVGSWTGIQAAIWTIMTPGFQYAAYANDGNTDWLAVAESADLTSFNFNTWNVLTVYENGRIANRQELIANTALAEGNGTPLLPTETPLAPTVTPEPETYLLLVSGLIFMAVLGRRRLRELGYI